MVEQVSIYKCSSEDLEALKVGKANKHLAKRLQNTFQKLGHGLSCMYKPSEVLSNLMERIEMQVTEEASEKTLQAQKNAKLQAEKKIAEATTTHLEAPLEAIDEQISRLPKNLERKESNLVTKKCDKLSKGGSLIVEQQLLTMNVDSRPHDRSIVPYLQENFVFIPSL